MVDAEAGKPRDDVTASQVVETDDTFAFVFSQHVVCTASHTSVTGRDPQCAN